MTTPHEELPATSGPAGAQATPEEAAAGVPGTPRVATAPPRARWRFGRVPARLGRARTSTVVLAVLWLLVALLWLDVRPPSAQIAPTGDTGTATTQPAARSTARSTSSAPTSTAPATSPAPGSRSTAATPTPAPATTAPGGTSSAATSAPARTSSNPTGTPAPPSTGAAPTS